MMFWIPVVAEAEKLYGWPVVPTILLPGMNIYTERRCVKGGDFDTHTVRSKGGAADRDGGNADTMEGSVPGKEKTEV
jgi:hypothetical protein